MADEAKPPSSGEADYARILSPGLSIIPMDDDGPGWPLAQRRFECMAHNEMRPARGNGTGLEDCLARQLDTSEDNATVIWRQVPVHPVSAASLDGDRPENPAVAWLVRRARISLAHAAVLAEVHGLGGA